MMITRIVNKKGQQKDKTTVFDELVKIDPNDKYGEQKAAGSIGGSVTNGYIVNKGEVYECTRDAKVNEKQKNSDVK